MAIKDIASLRRHLQWAIELEHSTIPPYLTALYSLHPGKNEAARDVILSVAIEEMLHLTLAANVLNAVGGTPHLDHPSFLPAYPAYLTHSNRAFQVPLGKFSQETLAVFLKIESPEAHSGLPEDDEYETIGQFYEAIEDGLRHLSAVHGEDQVFTGDVARQLGPESFHYDGAGAVLKVTNLATALHALSEIVEQGEGMDHQSVWDGDRSMFHPDHEEVSHYFRFQEILLGREFKRGDTPQSGPTGDPIDVDWTAVYNVRPNPRMAEYAHGSEIRTKMGEFNQVYCDLLRLMHRSFNGEPSLMAQAVGVMYEVKVKAHELMQMDGGDGMTAGMSFEYAPAAAPKPAEAALPVAPSITVRPNGPYVIEGEVKLRRKVRIFSDAQEAQTWRSGDVLRERGPYVLCRCGRSDSKPFCDGSHARAPEFDGTETADPGLRADRAKIYPGPKLNVFHDNTICATSTFCENNVSNVWDMAEKTDDNVLRAQVISMIERCPSGALTYELLPEHESNEPDLPVQISVTDNGPLWVSGRIPVSRSDGKPLEVRNRMTLCRCGHSKNKPLCDGSHIDAGFKG